LATYKNESAETFVFPSLGLVVEPGDSFDADADITTAGITAAVGGKKKADPVAPVDAPADPAPAAPAVADVTPAPVEEVK
jgi:hypothetical protein